MMIKNDDDAAVGSHWAFLSFHRQRTFLFFSVGRSPETRRSFFLSTELDCHDTARHQTAAQTCATDGKKGTKHARHLLHPPRAEGGFCYMIYIHIFPKLRYRYYKNQKNVCA